LAARLTWIPKRTGRAIGRAGDGPACEEGEIEASAPALNLLRRRDRPDRFVGRLRHVVEQRVDELRRRIEANGVALQSIMIQKPRMNLWRRVRGVRKRELAHRFLPQ
jgi:hypothetical protein